MFDTSGFVMSTINNQSSRIGSELDCRATMVNVFTNNTTSTVVEETNFIIYCCNP
ncbi:MAG: hypothetical protein ACI8RD_008490 [Bacillariaceae sp.]|jgi:hypothetical protein